jgi:hypothetical protein
MRRGMDPFALVSEARGDGGPQDSMEGLDAHDGCETIHGTYLDNIIVMVLA